MTFSGLLIFTALPELFNQQSSVQFSLKKIIIMRKLLYNLQSLKNPQPRSKFRHFYKTRPQPNFPDSSTVGYTIRREHTLDPPLPRAFNLVPKPSTRKGNIPKGWVMFHNGQKGGTALLSSFLSDHIYKGWGELMNLEINGGRDIRWLGPG